MTTALLLLLLTAGDALERRASETLTAVEMNVGDSLRYTLAGGATRTIVVEDVDARILITNLPEPKRAMGSGGTVYVMTCRLRVDGHPLTVRRYVPDALSFSEPIVVNGVRLWLDGVRPVEKFLNANHSPGDEKIGGGIPRKDARFALQDATLPLCPQELRPWYPLAAQTLDAAQCYNADDVWMGPYQGADLHGGLDLNMPSGTPLWTPIDFDDQYYFHSLKKGDNNNRWRGVRTWPNGQRWVLQAHHLNRLLVQEKQPLRQGVTYAETAGVHAGNHAHTHFLFKIGPEDDEIMLDPWLLFWETFENTRRRSGAIRASMTPPGPADAGRPVKFSSAGSRPSAAGNSLRFFWTFGDGAGSRDAEPTHAFARPGLYPVTLVVEDGVARATVTHHLTVDGKPTDRPVLALDFPTRPAGLMELYGAPVSLPHHLTFRARPKSSPRPPPQTIGLRNIGASTLAAPQVAVAYEEGEGWMSVTPAADSLTISVDASKILDRHGRYRARVEVTCPGALNSPQTFGVELDVPHPTDRPRTDVVVDDLDPGCVATPGFWLRPRFADHFPAKWKRGHGGTYLVNGGRSDQEQSVRFTPDLAAGAYTVSFPETTPFRPWDGAPEEVRFAVRVHHRSGTEVVWVEPLKSRAIGTFDFAEGTDGYVEILSKDARGQVVADAVRFVKAR
jgi:PKD repeat protein